MSVNEETPGVAGIPGSPAHADRKSNMDGAARSRSLWPAVLVLALLAVAAYVAWNSGAFGWRASDSAVIDALRQRAGTMAEPQKGTALLVAATFDQYRGIARMWSGVYNGCVLGASALGLLAALVLKLESAPQLVPQKKDAAAILASVGAILAALSSSGDFQVKWQANRTAVADVERIAVRLLAPTPPNLDEVYARLGEIAEERHLRLVGAKRSSEPSERPGLPEAGAGKGAAGSVSAASGVASAAGQASSPSRNAGGAGAKVR